MSCIVCADTENNMDVKEGLGKRIVFIAGPDSHSYGMHDFRGGVRYLAHCLRGSVSDLVVDIHEGGWPEDFDFFDGADAVVVYSDGLHKHILEDSHMIQLKELHDRGVGLGVMHYACAFEKGARGDRILECIGGYYETYWSVNPHWEAEFLTIPDHEVNRGVEPFVIDDEWYYNMRFREDMTGVTPLLTAVPPDKTRQRKHGPHWGNPFVSAQSGRPEHVAWVADNGEKGRGFAITGLHHYWNLGHSEMRGLVLNACAWLAGIEIPEEGVVSENPSLEFLESMNPGVPDAKWANGRRTLWEAKFREWNRTE
ncbi:ThuA domain-containing protein [Pelagicoccus mobilis]|uniref:ThuA domain-containing protein n=1 Tax=Pelagicoccus mobilis TaxID=415221 RepID=A0A934VPM5_9BACT|nr:ThuA domain-containing protein [Pelagicoccus mobilis]MBK1877447.1 ThuA domain-containing protein [Pelagicoccus mobilis]